MDNIGFYSCVRIYNYLLLYLEKNFLHNYRCAAWLFRHCEHMHSKLFVPYYFLHVLHAQFELYNAIHAACELLIIIVLFARSLTCAMRASIIYN